MSENATASQQPLVSVLTPVYNGERYLAECIESVLNQTYQNWEYIIVNNCSTDRTLEIATEYACHDSRIRIVNNSEFVTALRNHNIALTLLSRSSKYCKFVQADDVIFPTHLSEMVQLAENHPSVGIVSSYQLWGCKVRCDGLPYPNTVFSGKDVCRKYYFLSRERLWTGIMSAFLLRADLVRSRTPFMSERFQFADNIVFFDVLKDHDLGFVHQILTFRRIHEESQSAFFDNLNDSSFIPLYVTKSYGPSYLTDEEYKRCMKRAIDEYYRVQGHQLFRLREKSFWQYHRRMMMEIGFSFSPLQLLKGAAVGAADLLLEPFKAAARQLQYIRNESPSCPRRKCQKGKSIL